MGMRHILLASSLAHVTHLHEVRCQSADKFSVRVIPLTVRQTNGKHEVHLTSSTVEKLD